MNTTLALNKRILIISLSESRRDPRVMRHLAALRGQYVVDVAGYGDMPDGARRFFQIHRRLSVQEKMKGICLLLAGKHEQFYWDNYRMQSARAMLNDQTYDLILANDIDTLPLALTLGGAVLLDAHEYAPRQFEDRLAWRVLFMRYVHHLCRTFLPKVNGMFTVCRGIAQEYEHCYGVAPGVLSNAAEHVNLTPTSVDGQAVRMIHHGGATSSRRLETMIQMFRHLDERYHLDFMLMPTNARYLKKLKQKAAFCERIRFIDPVPMRDIALTTNKYDIGLFLLPPVNFNYAHALPNKFFEFVQARLAVAIGPSPEMADLARQHGFGIVADSFDPADLAGKLNALSAEDIFRLKTAAHHAAGTLSAEANKDILRTEVARVLGGREKMANLGGTI
jgi:hypothetical protein